MAKKRKPAGRALPGDLAAATPGEAKAPESPGDAQAQSDSQRFARWQGRVAGAIRLRKDWEETYDVEQCERYFLGQQDEQQVRLNHFAATVKTMRPSLFLQSPKFYVRPKAGKPTKPVGGHVAAVAEGTLESIARQDEHLEQAAALAVLQAFWRVGVIKTTYDPTLEPNPNVGAPVYETTEEGEAKRGEGGELVQLRHPLTGEPMTEPAEVLTDEIYRWRWVDAASLLLPDEGPDASQWTWIGEEVVVPLEEAKADTRFPEDVRARLRSNHARKRPKTDQQQSQGDSGTAEEFLKYVEVYDRKAKRLLIWADGQDTTGFLHDDLVPGWIDNDPYSVLMLGEPITGPEPSPWPVPVTRDWIPAQNEYNIRRRQIMEGAKRSARKGVYEDGAFDDQEEAMKAMQSPDDMAFAKGDPNKVKILEAPDLNPSIYRDIPLLINDWRIITGQTGARMSKPDADTATEATFVERAANLRDATGQRLVLRWLAEAGGKMLQCLKHTLTLDVWVAMREMNDKEFALYLERNYGIPTAQQAMMVTLFPGLKTAFRERFGHDKWVQVTRESLQFESDVSVAPGSTKPKNLEAERTQFLQFLRVLGQAPQLALSRELMAHIARMFEIEDDRLLDELQALAQQMVQIQAKVAGRDQGGASGVPTGQANGSAILASLMAAGGGAG